ncbi:hypothetical protein MTsPCn9_34500 [Croceitalea sp. MTPC9]|uniref:hypothetical protein n=1 Tax=unclassified Croceitalea TaxID=2632280 RepID=UPI002B3F1FA1|nr:hypothetical protein MTsPCn6_34450 [Croceitalea sp. MTPC6]GMN18510.1 hypothetical protein MTsPCn9_34500 [Croceitalea sp. MTPC9]
MPSHRKETIKYKIGKRKKEYSISIDEILEPFSKSKEGENYTKYYYPFNVCMHRFLMNKIEGIRMLSDGQLTLLEKKFKQREK